MRSFYHAGSKTRDLDDTLVVICYTSKSYAQATTNVLSALGYDMSKVYTLEARIWRDKAIR